MVLFRKEGPLHTMCLVKALRPVGMLTPTLVEGVVGIVYERGTAGYVGPRLNGIGVGVWLTVCVVLAVVFVRTGVICTWSGRPHRSVKSLADVTGVIFGDVSVSSDVHTDSVEVCFVRRQLTANWL